MGMTVQSPGKKATYFVKSLSPPSLISIRMLVHVFLKQSTSFKLKAMISNKTYNNKRDWK